MVTEFAKQNFDHKILGISLMGLDFDFNGKGQFYKEPPVTIESFGVA
jgi:hypothetical protein